MIHYRAFRNPDPPLLAAVWNASLTGRRAVPMQAATLLEYFTFAKPYFDPAGMIFAFEDDRPIGVVHAGFVAAADNKQIDTSVGVISLLAVVLSHRRRGVGANLLSRAEEYLRKRGATELLVGGMAPRNPYLFGLYGGCNSPGVLDSDGLARPFLEHHGYQVARSCGVFQRDLDRMHVPADARFGAIRQRYDIVATPYSHAGWWRECVLGPIEAVEYRLQDKQNEEIVARAVMWDMETFAHAWNETCVGLIDLEVKPAFRRQGIAKYLLAQVMRYLRQQPFHTFEALADLDNQAFLGLLRGLEFQQVDTGHVFRHIAPG